MPANPQTTAIIFSKPTFSASMNGASTRITIGAVKLTAAAVATGTYWSAQNIRKEVKQNSSDRTICNQGR
ncbi:hypothetical protein PsSCT_01330 [Pseudomonas sp. SCT]